MKIRNALRGVWFPVAASVAVVGLLVYLVVAVASLTNQLEDANDARDALAVELDAQEKTSEALARQIEEMGGDPIVEPDEADEEAIPDEADDSTGEISQGDIALAVASWCADTGKCRGADGEDGRDVTPAMVAAAVASYCNSDGECRGPAGEDGEDGTDGEPGADGEDGQDGTIGEQGPVGPAGPPPSDEAVAAAVAAYCDAHDGCRGPTGADGQPGPKGEPGPAGPAGADGRGIQALECMPDGTWLVTYTDGTTSTTPGPCRAEQPPIDPEIR